MQFSFFGLVVYELGFRKSGRFGIIVFCRNRYGKYGVVGEVSLRGLIDFNELFSLLVVVKFDEVCMRDCLFFQMF